MNIEIRTDKNIDGSERLIDYIRTELASEFQRYSEKITHFSVHLSDENGDKKNGENDIRCMIEARPAGLHPIAVTNKANTIDLSVNGAIDKLQRSLEHTFEKLESSRGGRVEFKDEDDAE